MIVGDVVNIGGINYKLIQLIPVRDENGNITNVEVYQLA